MGINGLWGNFGIACAPLIAGILSYWIGWKSALIIFGIMGIIFGIVCFIVPFSVGKVDLQKVHQLRKGRLQPFLLFYA